ncbi:MAG: Hpt domain-containing protein [Alphaproteobacteria bacterium]
MVQETGIDAAMVEGAGPDTGGSDEAQRLFGGPPATGPIDLGYLDWYTAGDRDVRADILRIFKTQAAAWLAEFDPSLTDEAWAALAHSLKGSARGVGAFGLADLAEQAEGLTGPEGRAGRADCLNALQQAVRDVQDAIDRVAA